MKCDISAAEPILFYGFRNQIDFQNYLLLTSLKMTIEKLELRFHQELVKERTFKYFITCFELMTNGYSLMFRGGFSL